MLRWVSEAKPGWRPTPGRHPAYSLADCDRRVRRSGAPDLLANVRGLRGEALAYPETPRQVVRAA